MFLYLEPDGHFASPLYLSDLLPPASRILFEDTEVGEYIYLSIYLLHMYVSIYVFIYLIRRTTSPPSLYLSDLLPPASRILFEDTEVGESIYLSIY